MVALAKKLGIPSKLITELEKADAAYINAVSEKCVLKGFNILKMHSEITCLAVILCLAVKVKDKYDEYGIDERIYYDTMSDIRIWCGKEGIKNYGWLKNHVSFELFRIGRLQYQIYECKNKTLLYQKLPFAYGDKLIYIHIPEGEKLEKESCIASLKLAKSFFCKYFPDYNYKYYFCESWLLYEGNRVFMQESSNIVSFMSLFDIRYSVNIDVQAIERIYGKRHLFKKNYPENTSLQKSAKEHMLKGGKLGIGIGVIEASE